MCGRYALWAQTKYLQHLFELDLLVDSWDGSWNAAPGQALPAVFERYETIAPPSEKFSGKKRVRRLQKLEWGLVPSWAKQPRGMINARLETVAEKPSFAQSLQYRRCLVPANGYYEWQQLDGRKQPYFFSQAPGDPVMAFAGIYDAWRQGGPADSRAGGEVGPWRRTFAIITQAAPDSLGHIHDRTPVIIPEYMWDRWLDPAVTEPRAVLRMIEAMERIPLVPRPVSRAVGSVRNDRPQLVEEVDLAGE